MMRIRKAWPLAVTAACVVSTLGWLLSDGPRSTPSAVVPDPIAAPDPVAASPDCEVELPVEVATRYPPGSRVAVRLPPVRTGIPLGDGVFLPPLNGVRVEDGIPPIRRDPRLPPPGPVVAKQVDLSGQEWWIHADGSQTSCSFASITARGEDVIIVSTQHGAVRPGGHGALSRAGRSAGGSAGR